MNDIPNPLPNGAPAAPPFNHRQRKSIEVAARIYAEFRWNIKKLPEATWADIIQLLDAAIKLCGDLIPDETIRREAIAHFKASKEKAQKVALTQAKANIAALTGEGCVKCGHVFELDEPKTWVADGEYVCSRCQ